jgi:hypothetical protein
LHKLLDITPAPYVPNSLWKNNSAISAAFLTRYSHRQADLKPPPNQEIGLVDTMS